jgi:hypothetical protein
VSFARALQPSSKDWRRGSSNIGNLVHRVVWVVRFIVRTSTHREVMVVQYESELSLNCCSDVPTMYVLPMEKHELELVTSTCTMSCNILLHDYTRHHVTCRSLIIISSIYTDLFSLYTYMVYSLVKPNVAKFSFSPIYKSNSNVCHGLGGFGWHKHILKHSKHHPQCDASQTAKLDIAHRQSQSPSPSPIYGAQCLFKLASCEFYSLPFQIHKPCVRRELPCSIHTPARRKPILAH